MARTCPDCGVELDQRGYVTSFSGDTLRIGASGVLGRLGLRGTTAAAFVCHECGLVRFYVPSGGEKP